MPRRRIRSYRRSRPLKTVKYSNETYNATVDFTLGANQQATTPLISAIDAQGTRKAKNFTLRFVFAGDIPLMFALVYLPQGQQVGNMTFGTVAQPLSLYEPNQNVILSGYIPPSSNQAPTFRTRLARNLNSGDSIVLIIRAVGSTAISEAHLGVMLNYAISY